MKFVEILKTYAIQIRSRTNACFGSVAVCSIVIYAHRAPKRELVIAHYRGELEWINSVSNFFDVVTIYHKLGSQNNYYRQTTPTHVRHVYLDNNVGREAYTFLIHIVSRYDTLATQYTVFSQDGFEDKIRFEDFVRICKGEAMVNCDFVFWDLTMCEIHLERVWYSLFKKSSDCHMIAAQTQEQS